MTASEEFRRVSIRAGTREIDVSLPCHVPIGELLPAAADLVTTDGRELRTQLFGRPLNLSRPGAARLDQTKSLAQCGIDDGELLILTTARIPPPEYRVDACVAIRGAVQEATLPWRRATNDLAAVVALSLAAALELTFLGLPFFDSRFPRLPLVGALSATIAALSAMFLHRRGSAVSARAALGVATVCFATISGALAVPGSPGISHFLIATSICSTICFCLGHLSGCGTGLFIPISTLSAVASGATLGSVLQWWPTTAIGPILIDLSLATLISAPRLATRASHLSTADAIDDNLRRRAEKAHELLTQLTIASAVVAVSGVITSSIIGPRNAVFEALVAAAGAAFLLNSRRHTESRRVAALLSAAVAAGTSLVISTTLGESRWVPWVCCCLALLAAVTPWLTSVASWPTSSTSRHLLDMLEFMSAAAVVPLTCWTVGLFGAVRSLSIA